jgi:hypothetical protein
MALHPHRVGISSLRGCQVPSRGRVEDQGGVPARRWWLRFGRVGGCVAVWRGLGYILPPGRGYGRGCAVYRCGAMQGWAGSKHSSCVGARFRMWPGDRFWRLFYSTSTLTRRFTDVLESSREECTKTSRNVRLTFMRPTCRNADVVSSLPRQQQSPHAPAVSRACGTRPVHKLSCGSQQRTPTVHCLSGEKQRG